MQKLHWWKAKVLCSVTLIACVFLSYVTNWYPESFGVNTELAITVVLLGGSIFFYHYYLIKRKNRKFDSADVLVTSPGLFSYIRHPMYFGELLMIFGYMLLAFNLLTLLAFSIGAFALVKQSQAEDLFLANAHKSSHAQWLESTKLVIPGVY